MNTNKEESINDYNLPCADASFKLVPFYFISTSKMLAPAYHYIL